MESIATPAMPTSPGDARMVRIVAAVGGEVEGDREALLARREVAPVEGVRILGRGEAGILPDRPRLVDVHGRVGAAQIRRQARIGVEEIEPGGAGGPEGGFPPPFRGGPPLLLLLRGGGARPPPPLPPPLGGETERLLKSGI